MVTHKHNQSKLHEQKRSPIAVTLVDPHKTITNQGGRKQGGRGGPGHPMFLDFTE